MEKNFDIEKQRLLTVKQVIAIVTFFVVITFAIAGIYFRFLVMEKEIKGNTDKIDYVNERLSRKTK